jgi:hypothetical protein
MNAKRPTTVTLGAALLALFSLLSLASPLVPAFSAGVPPLVVYSGVVLGILGLVAGLWTLKRWSVWLTVIVSVLNILSGAPGLLFAPTTTLFVGSLVGVGGFALIIASQASTSSS